MLVLPVRSLKHSTDKHDQTDDLHIKPSLRPQQSDKQSTSASENRETTDAMISVMSTTRAPPSKRPKLSLQTLNVSPTATGHKTRPAHQMTKVTESPITDSTCTKTLNPSCSVPNARQSPVASPESRSHDYSSPSPSNCSGSTVSSGYTSPCPTTVPYTLSIGPRSILRNSPLPQRLVSATTVRTAKVRFPPTKRVCFQERLEEVIPTQIMHENPEELSDTSIIFDVDVSDERLEDDISERRALDELLEEEASTTKPHSRRKRARDWIWRPLDDDILASNGEVSPTKGATTDVCRRPGRITIREND